MKKIIYIVTKGAYSDYGIYGVFEDGAIAKEYCNQISGTADYDKAYIEEHEVMDSSNLIIKAGFEMYSIIMEENGDSRGERIAASQTIKDHPQTLINRGNLNAVTYSILIRIWELKVPQRLPMRDECS